MVGLFHGKSHLEMDDDWGSLFQETTILGPQKTRPLDQELGFLKYFKNHLKRSKYMGMDATKHHCLSNKIWDLIIQT